MNSPSFSRIYLESTFLPNHFEFTICFAISLWLHYLFRELSMHSLSALRLTMNTLSFSRIYSLFCDFTMDSPSVSRIYLESTFFLRITLNSLSASRLHYEFTICFANSPRIHFFYWITINSLWNHYEITMKPLWNHYEFTIFFATSLGIHHLFREFTICFANSLSIHYLFREWILYLLSLLRNHYDFAIE